MKAKKLKRGGRVTQQEELNTNQKISGRVVLIKGELDRGVAGLRF